MIYNELEYKIGCLVNEIKDLKERRKWINKAIGEKATILNQLTEERNQRKSYQTMIGGIKNE